MKLYKRCLSLLLLSVCLFGVFSLDVKAEGNNNYQISSYFLDTNGNYSGFPKTDVGTNITFQSKEYTANMNNSYVMYYYMSFTRKDGNLLLKKNEVFDATATNFLPYLYFSSTENSYYWEELKGCYIQMIYTDGTSEMITEQGSVEYTFSSKNNRSTLKVSGRMTAKKDVQEVRFIMHYSPYNEISTSLGNRTFLFYAVHQPVSFEIDIQSEEAGLLSGIIGWVQNIFNKIEDTFQAITELPSKIWQLISDGLKALFIPDDDFIVGFKDKFDELLADRLGAVYQVGDVLIDSWEKIEEADEKDTVTMPKVSINLPENNKFEFGGFDVKIVPDGFSVLVNAVKLILGIVCTCLFFNGLLKRYDEVMGVEQ